MCVGQHVVAFLTTLFCVVKSVPSAFSLKYKQAQLSLGSGAQVPASHNCLCDHRGAVLCGETLPALWHCRIRTNTSPGSQMPPVNASPRCWVGTRCYFHGQQGSWFSPSV